MLKNKLKKIVWLIKLGVLNLKIRTLIFFNKEIDNSCKYRLFVKITDACNYKCFTCGNWKKNSRKDLSKAEEEEIIQKFSDQLFFLTVTGGEPFLNPKRLTNFIKKIKAKNPNLRYISINTNCSNPQSVQKVITQLTNEFADLNIFIGLHFIPNYRWGKRKTGIKEAHENYKRTLSVLKSVKKELLKRITIYKIATINSREDVKIIKNSQVEDLWINFAQTEDFYNNKNRSDIGQLKKVEKIKLIDFTLQTKSISYLNKRYLQELKKTIKNGRIRRCYSGINRAYIDNYGKEYICFKGLKSRAEMNQKKCLNCWVSCESNFDFIPDFFMPAIFKSYFK